MHVDRGDGAATRASVSASTADVRETAWMHRDHSAVCVMTTTRPGIVLNAEDRAKGRTELMCAAAGGHTGVISAILNHEPGVDLEAKDNEQESTAVLYAALHGQVSAMQMLVEYGADVNAKNDDGQGVLFVAAFDGHVGIIEPAIAAGVNVQTKSNEGGTALHCAAACGHVSFTKALLAAGADACAMDDVKVTPLMTASRGGFLEVVGALLESCGAQCHSCVNAKDKDGQTAMNYAMMYNQDNVAVPILRALIAAGADVNSTMDQGRGASWSQGICLHSLARIKGHRACANLLLSAGAEPDPQLDDARAARMSTITINPGEGADCTIQ